MINTDQIRNSFDKMKSLATAAGAQVELTLSEGDSFSASYQDRKLKKYSSSQNQSASIRVLKGKGVGLSSTENLDEEALLSCFSEALQSAEDLNFADSPKILEELIEDAGSYPEVRLFYSDYEDVPIAQRLEWAESLEKNALDFDKRISNVPYSGMSLSSGLTWILNSKGIDRSYQQSGIGGYSYSLAKKGDKAMEGGSSFFSRSPKGIDAGKAAVEGAEKALALLEAEQPRTGMFPVLMVNEVVSELLSVLEFHISAKTVDENKSLLKGRIGEVVLSDKVTIVDDPLNADMSGARPFDMEGSPSQKTVVFENGKLASFLTNSYYARKLGLSNTSNAVRSSTGLDVSSSNFCMKPGTKSFEELVALFPEVIVITEATGFHSGVKKLTGDFSLPSYGFLYKNGVKTQAIEQFVVSGNVFEIFKDVVDSSTRLNRNGSSTVAPDVLFNKMSVAGSSNS